MISELQILYLSGDATSADIVQSALGADWDVSFVDDLVDITQNLSNKNIDCIVCDDSFDSRSGIDIYNQNEDVIGDTPYVLFSSTSASTYLQRAIRSGVDDVVIKTMDAESDGGVDTESINQMASLDDVEPDSHPSSFGDSVTQLRYRIATLLLDKQLDIEETVFSSIRSLFGAADDELDLKIDFALESVGDAIGGTRCIVYEFNEGGDGDDDDGGVYNRMNQWCGKDSDCVDCDLSVIGAETISADEYPGHETHATQFESVCRDWTPTSNMSIYSKTDIEDSNSYVGTFISHPIAINWELQGVIVVTTKYPRTWDEQINRQLKSLGEVILTTKQQRDNRIQLEEQNERLEQFTSVISHDLKNPLAIAQGYVDISLKEDDVVQLTEASDALHRMEDMIDELLTLAKQGESIGETTPTDVATVVNNSWNNVDTKQATLVTDGLESISKRQADPSRLQEAIENLIKNAIDHVGEDVEITAKQINGGFAIGDDGDGIPDDELDQIFDRGYTGGNGTGFGLAIVEEVVDAHGWNIEVSESDAGGAEFRILLDD